jgi:hypothetical protein
LKLKRGQARSNFAFRFNLRRYTEDVRDVFEAFDVNGDGYVNVSAGPKQVPTSPLLAPL